MYKCTLIPCGAALASPAVLADELRKAREAAGLTQEGLAAKAGLSREYINYLERGKREPTLPMFVRVCDAIGVHPPEMLERVLGRRPRR